MGRLTTDACLSADSTAKEKEVEVPELGGSFLIRELPGTFSVQHFMEVDNPGTAQVKSKINYQEYEVTEFSLGVVDPSFTEEQATQFAEKHGRAFRRVIVAIDELSAIDKEGVEQTAARFPSGGTGKAGPNGSPQPAEGDGGPDLRVRAGAGIEDDGD